MNLRCACGLHIALSFFSIPAAAFALPFAANPVARFDSAFGSFRVELFADQAPLSVANFTNYVSSGRYQDVFIHRSVPGFVLQGGGFTFPSDAQGVTPVPQFPTISNEAGISNIRGTLAVARLPDPNSGGSQWFFNLIDNSPTLDQQNGGAAVFGQVLDGGMTVVNAIAALPRIHAGTPALAALPVTALPTGPTLLREHVVIVGIQIVPEPAASSLLAVSLIALQRRPFGPRQGACAKRRLTFLSSRSSPA